MIKLEPLPMKEAQQFWDDKVKLSASEFSKLSDEAKLKAFAVSGIAKGDELSTVFGALQKAIDDGISFDEFKKDCGDIFERRGWTGLRSWRVDNIFRTNIQTAYNVGQYKQLREDSEIFPYWQYSAINDSRTRATHLGMDGKVWPKDHAVWDTWYPPNGYRCRCSVIGLTANQVEKRGIKVEKDDITGNLITPIDPRTGNPIPARPMIPDVGFAMNPGKSYWAGIGEVVEDRIETWPRQLSLLALDDLVESEVFESWLKDPKDNFPVGRLKAEDAKAIGSEVQTVTLSQETAIKQLKNHPEIKPAEYLQVQQALDHGEAIQDGAKSMVFLLEEEGYVSVVKSTVSGQKVFLTSFRRLSSVEAKKDKEVLRLRGKGE